MVFFAHKRQLCTILVVTGTELNFAVTEFGFLYSHSCAVSQKIFDVARRAKLMLHNDWVKSKSQNGRILCVVEPFCCSGSIKPFTEAQAHAENG